MKNLKINLLLIISFCISINLNANIENETFVLKTKTSISTLNSGNYTNETLTNQNLSISEENSELESNLEECNHKNSCKCTCKNDSFSSLMEDESVSPGVKVVLGTLLLIIAIIVGESE